MLQIQFPGTNPLRPQRRVWRIALIADIEVFIAVWSAEGRAINGFDVRVRGRFNEQTQSRAESVPKPLVPVAAQSGDKGYVFANGVFVLKVESPDPSGAVIVQVEEVRLDVVVDLLLLKVLAKFGAEGDVVPFEEDAGSIALKIPPRSVGCVVVLREGRDACARIVVDVDAVIAVPVVGKPSQRFPASEDVPVLHVRVTSGVGGAGARVVEDGPEGSGGNVFRARSLDDVRSEEHTSELQSRLHLVCRLLLEKKNNSDVQTYGC